MEYHFAYPGGVVANNKTLYEVLEVARNASPDTIEAAYRTLSAKLNARSDPGARVLRMAVEDAYRTLSHPELRRRYDAKLVTGAPVQAVAAGIDEPRPWTARNAVILVALGVLVAAGYGYSRHVEKEKERVALAKALKEKEEILARQKEAEEERVRQRAEAEALRKERIEEAKLRQWADQTRREQASYARRLDYERTRAEQDAKREVDRQRRMEEMQKQREEAEARQRLEQEKRRLQRLEAENYGSSYGYRRY
jgi:curved DNA-binding protein CbpA